MAFTCFGWIFLPCASSQISGALACAGYRRSAARGKRGPRIPRRAGGSAPVLSRRSSGSKPLPEFAGRQGFGGAKLHLQRGVPGDLVPGATYPDGGCIVEFYGNADPVSYVEQETVGPLEPLRVGESASATNRYVLARRTSTDLDSDASALLALSP